MVKFTLIVCVYAKDKPEYLQECLESVVAQSKLPDELLIVKDGPLGESLEGVLDSLCYPGQLGIISLPENVTLGPARQMGVNAAKHEWVAVMDSDDICKKDRFEKQLRIIETIPGVGLLGGQSAEFYTDASRPEAYRRVPVEHEKIVEFLKKRNPFNHQTVMFKKQCVQRAGGYRYFPWFEDYDLWARMISTGTICANHPDVLVNARAGEDMYNRRRGIRYIKQEWRMQKQLRRLGLIQSMEFCRNIMFRIPVRLLPAKTLARIYKRFAR